MRADRTICTSNAERDELAAVVDGEALNRIVVVHNGVEPQPPTAADARAEARAELGVADDDVLCLCVGRLDEFKDPAHTRAGGRGGAASDAPIVAAFAGDGPLLSALQARDERTLRALGHRDDLARLFAAADVFVPPSTREGLSMALLEGMSHGLPAVRVGRPRQPGGRRRRGRRSSRWGTRMRSPTALRRLARDRDERVRLGALRRRERADRHFSRTLFLERMAAVYREVLRD